MNNILLIFFFIEFLCQFSCLSIELESISQSQSLTQGSTLVSRDGTFELGFFSPGSSGKYYLGIWYKKIPAKTYVWVANRISPINDTSGVLSIDESGNLVLLSNNETLVWSTNITNPARSPILELLETGNLVLRDGDDSSSGNYLWQSFDYPTDTVLAEMKIGWDKRTGIDRRLTAWRSPDDPSPGDFNWGLEHYNSPEAIAYKGKKKYFSSGPWNGLRYSGAPEQKPNPIFLFDFVNNEDEVYYVYYLRNKSVLTRTVLNQTTYGWERYTWSEATNEWNLFSSVPKDYCDNYGLCGANGNCNMNNLPVCQCLHGFVPKSPDKWAANDWSQGCVRANPMECDGKHGFVKFTGLKLPDTEFSWVNASFGLKECRDKCLSNCSCMAYASYDIRGKGSGCTIWFGNLLDIRSFPDGGQDLYIRMPASEIGVASRPEVKIAVAVACSIAAVFLIVLAGCYMHRSRVKFKAVSQKNVEDKEKVRNNETSDEDLELPAFDLATIASATKNFSVDNKLGEGGFGSVYKGILVDGREIAVKRLSRSSGQGLKEFKNEVILIAKLQHRNLVRLLGCCIQGEEKMLIYEYMRNRSLDAFIFDNKKGNLLNWPKRFNIICGVARGLLYLHQDSRLRIIHRDLKASNVLLDDNMNPKISDFGMARTFGGDQYEGNTNRVVGTYGYMAPEYAIDGLFSVKSDVFSFGILILEIISGKRNRGLFHSNQNLIGHAWRLHTEGKPLELIDERLQHECTLYEVMRCIHISFLCLQHLPEDRPTMASVAVMLGSETELPPPKQPGFLIDKGPYEGDTSSSKYDSHSANEITVTLIQGR